MEKRKILLADDTALFLEMEKTYLSRDKFELSIARSGRETLQKALAERPHLILLSLVLPDVSGEDICRTIKADPEFPDTRVVIVTGDHDERTLTRCIDAGCDGIVTKPFDKDQLLETVQKLLGETFRREPRYVVEIPCAIYLEREGIPGTIIDLSAVGCRIRTEDPLPLAGSIGLGFSLPETDQPVHWKAIVRWVASTGSDGTHLSGVEYAYPPAGDLQTLQDILASMPARHRL